MKYAKGLTVELEDCKQKEVIATQIITDLKKAGSDNMGSLIDMLHQYRERDANCEEEINKLKQLSLIKDNEIQDLEIEVRSLTDFLASTSARQAQKIYSYKKEIDENRVIIKR